MNGIMGSRRFYLSLVAVLAWSATAVDSVLTILDAALLSAGQVSFTGLAIVASALDVVALVCVGLFSVQYVWRKGGIIKHSALTRRIFAISCILASLGALIVSLVLLVIIKRKQEEVTSATSRATISNWSTYLAVQFALWVVACIAQIILFTAPLWVESVPEASHPESTSGLRDSVMSEVRDSQHTPNLYMLQPTQPSSPLAGLPSPTFSARSSQSLKSWRDSLHQVVRPVTSRTKLISRPSFNRDSHSIYSIDNVSRPDGFDSWDTSSVDPQAREAALQSAPSRGTALEPIPGSRPVSPARALDGPFLLESNENEAPALNRPPKMVPDTSRPPSPVVTEAHIHPLFRTESPTPPPATPGTSIIASPLSNQMITCPPRPYSRMRSNSRPSSPSPLMHSQSFQGRAIKSQPSSRSPSPPSREMTPPIPDFVLNSSPRSSLSAANSRRKVHLQLDTGR